MSTYALKSDSVWSYALFTQALRSVQTLIQLAQPSMNCTLLLIEISKLSDSYCVGKRTSWNFKYKKIFCFCLLGSSSKLMTSSAFCFFQLSDVDNLQPFGLGSLWKLFESTIVDLEASIIDLIQAFYMKHHC